MTFLGLKMIIFGHFSRFLAFFKISFSSLQHPSYPPIVVIWYFFKSDCTTGWGNNHQHGYTLYYQHFSEDWFAKVNQHLLLILWLPNLGAIFATYITNYALGATSRDQSYIHGNAIFTLYS